MTIYYLIKQIIKNVVKKGTMCRLQKKGMIIKIINNQGETNRIGFKKKMFLSWCLTCTICCCWSGSGLRRLGAVAASAAAAAATELCRVDDDNELDSFGDVVCCCNCSVDDCLN